MKNTLTTLGASAALSMGLVFAAQAERINTEGPYACNGQAFAGDYLAQSSLNDGELSADLVNVALGETLVSDVTDHGSFVEISLINPGRDCDDVMQDLLDTGLFDSVSPNWIMQINGPGIEIT